MLTAERFKNGLIFKRKETRLKDGFRETRLNLRSGIR